MTSDSDFQLQHYAKKKILFLLGTLEKSKCGVSDYVHFLAERLSLEGYNCLCVALNDKYLKETKSIVYECSNQNKYQCHRFPQFLSWRFKHNELKKIIKSFDPDLISLQFVPYSFNSKGFPLLLLLSIKLLVVECNWHIMAHELWTMPRHGFFKRIFSHFQKHLIFVLFKSVNPRVIHVS